MWQKLMHWDQELLIFLNTQGSTTYDPLWTTITKFPPWIPFLALIVFLFFYKFPKREAVLRIVFILVLVGFVALLSNLTKEWVGRLRPCNDPAINGLLRILRKPSDFSFFSGHASISFSVVILAYLYLRKHYKLAWALFIWPLLFSYSRLYLGVHFPTDILAGASIACCCALMFYKLSFRVIQPY